MQSGQRVSLIIPCYNESDGLRRLLPEVPPWVDEIIVVDNNCTDDTAAVAQQAGARVVRERQQGYGYAHRAGMAAATGDILTTLDGDGQYPPAALARVIAPIADHTADFVVGSRVPFPPRSIPLLRRIGNALLNLAGTVLFGMSLRDNQSGMWAVRREALARLRLVRSDMAFSEEIKYKAMREGLRVREVYVGYRPRSGTSKLLPFSAGARNAWYLVTLWWETLRRGHPAASRSPLVRAAVGGILCAAILLPRLIGLGSILTTDEPMWQARAHTFYQGIVSGNPAQTYHGAQPAVTTMWLAGLATRFGSAAASQATIALGVSATLLVTAVFLFRLLPAAAALAGLLLVALDPFFIAHSRVVQSDALLASFLFLAAVLLALAARDGKPRYFLFAGIATTLAVLSKVFGLILLPVAAIVAGRRQVLTRRRRALLLGAPALLTLLLWPAVFSPSVLRTRGLAHLTKPVFASSVGRGEGDPWFYVREIPQRLTPTTSVLGVVGVAALTLTRGRRGRRFPQFPGRGFFTAAITLSLLYLFALTVGAQKADRYALPVVLVVDLLAGAAIAWIASLAVARRWPVVRGITLGVLTAAAAGSLLAVDLRLHPYYLAHWNALLPMSADAKLGWGEGLEQVAAYFQERGFRPGSPRIATYYPRLLSVLLPDSAPEQIERFTHVENPSFEYAVLYRSMFGRGEGAYETEAVTKFLTRNPREGETVTADGATFRLEKLITVVDIPYAWIFRRMPGP